MDVILLSDRRNLGIRGDIVSVKPGYARNFLLPRGVALEATPGNLKYFQEQKAKIDARHAQERDEAAAIAAQLSEIRLEIAKRVGETETLYGSVTTSDIGAMLEEKGFEVNRRRINVDGGAIKTLGDHKVTVDLHTEVVAEIVVTVIPEE
ncbi:MAG: 50S ribosomal protein L9 [Acidobacteriota bacterium]